MITLRDLVRADVAIASITTVECHLVAEALRVLANLSRSIFFRWLIPASLRHQALSLTMLSAVLGRTPAEREPCLNEQIRIAMERDR